MLILLILMLVLDIFIEYIIMFTNANNSQALFNDKKKTRYINVQLMVLTVLN